MLISPPIDISAAAHPVLDAKVYYDLARGLDGALVFASTDGAHWTALAPDQRYPVAVVQSLNGNDGYSGTSAGWEDCYVDLSLIAGSTSAQIGFAVYTDASSTSSAGLFVDDFTVADASALPAAQPRPGTTAGSTGGSTSAGSTSSASGSASAAAAPSRSGGGGCAVGAASGAAGEAAGALLPWLALVGGLALASARRRG
jgi:hypothetical protein